MYNSSHNKQQMIPSAVRIALLNFKLCNSISEISTKHYIISYLPYIY